MYPINSELPKAAADVKTSNAPSPYLPIATNRRNAFSWSAVEGLVMSTVLSRDLGGYTLEQYKEDCRSSFATRLDEESFWSIIEKMYFSEDSAERVTPEFSLFEAVKSKRTPTAERLAKAFGGLLYGYESTIQKDYPLTFVEKILHTTLNEHLSPIIVGPFSRLESYLPFLSQQFQKDLSFILSQPRFLNETFQCFLQLYGFLYVTQLALNVAAWSEGEPKARPLFFITDNEKASSERQYVKNYGFRSLRGALEHLFPILSLAEVLGPIEGGSPKQIPLWKLAQELTSSKDQEQLVSDLSAYAKAFKAQRQLNGNIPNSDEPLDWIHALVELSIEQFSPGRDRFKPNMEIVQDIEEKLCDGFLQLRGRAGKTLVFSQDHIMLLTNLTIGHEERMRLHELLEGFQDRGVFFDKQSEQVLVEFFERIGNVERMSDSGDAVYVRKTI